MFPSLQIRLCAIGLIVEGPKTTQLFTGLELEWARRFLDDNVANEDAAFRQQMNSCVKKLLTKMRDSRIRKAAKALSDETAVAYDRFADWLLDGCFSNLGPQSTFTRRFCSLQWLVFYQETLTFDDRSFARFTDSPARSAGCIASLIDCLSDSFDSNQQMSLRLLRDASVQRLLPRHHQWIQRHLQSGLTLCQSVKPADTLAAAFLLRWLAFQRSPLDVDQLPVIR